MCEITVPVNHYDVITFHWKSSANPRWNYTGNGRILRGSAAIRGGIKIFRGGIISGQVSGIAGGSEKSSAGVGGLVKIPLDCTVISFHFPQKFVFQVFVIPMFTLLAGTPHFSGSITQLLPLIITVSFP